MTEFRFNSLEPIVQLSEDTDIESTNV